MRDRCGRSTVTPFRLFWRALTMRMTDTPERCTFTPFMAKLLTPKLILRGFEIFVVASLAGFAITLLYGNNLPAFTSALGRLHWGWLLVGVGLASMDWFGGGIRLWVVAREAYPNPPLQGRILAGGMSAWAAYVTPLQSGAGPMMMYTMRRYGVPLSGAASPSASGAMCWASRSTICSWGVSVFSRGSACCW